MSALLPGAPACVKPRLNPRGFTLVELVTIIILIGIVGAIGVSRFAKNPSFETYSYADRMAAMLRYGQKLAVAQNRSVYIDLNGSRIALCFDATCTAPNRVTALAGSNSGRSTTVAQCGSAWECEAPPNGVSYASAVTSFSFDALGKPFAAADAHPDSTFATLTITVIGGGSSKAVIVERETGYVH